MTELLPSRPDWGGEIPDVEVPAELFPLRLEALAILTMIERGRSAPSIVVPTKTKKTTQRVERATHAHVDAELANGLPSWALDALVAMKPIMTRAEAARELTISERELDELTRAKVIAKIPQGRRVTFSRFALVEYLMRQAGERPLS